jgi:hypothetical protein
MPSSVEIGLSVLEQYANKRTHAHTIYPHDSLRFIRSPVSATRQASRRSASGCQGRIVWRKLGWVGFGYAVLNLASLVLFSSLYITLVSFNLVPISLA